MSEARCEAATRTGLRCRQAARYTHAGLRVCSTHLTAVVTEHASGSRYTERSPRPPDTEYPGERMLALKGVHDPASCAGRGCSVHHPSDHPMAPWPGVWRNGKGIFERVCPHGVGHPDPDDLAYMESIGNEAVGVHGCDGCCSSREEGS